MGYCLNLTDSAFVPILQNEYSTLKLRLGNDELPRNIGGKDNLQRHLDCAIIEQLHKHMKKRSEKPFDSVRGIFIEGSEIYEGSGFFEKTHIQICVRNPNCIKGYFAPLSENLQYDLP